MDVSVVIPDTRSHAFEDRRDVSDSGMRRVRRARIVGRPRGWRPPDAPRGEHLSGRPCSNCPRCSLSLTAAGAAAAAATASAVGLDAILSATMAMPRALRCASRADSVVERAC